MNKVTYLSESSKCMTKEEVVREASKCDKYNNIENCISCPINIDAKEIISLVKNEKFDEASKLLRKQNPIAAITARVCPYESYCVGSLRKEGFEDPIMMSFVERFLTEHEMKENLLQEIENEVEIDEDSKVAVIGSGPSGLSAAAQLARLGNKVVVFDDRNEAGGWLRYGIPPHRLPKEVIKYDIDYLKKLGVEFINNKKVGADITIDELRNQGYKAFLLATGFNLGRIIRAKGYDLNGVVDGVSFLANAKGNDGNVEHGKSAIIIGGGDVAMDCATTAKLIGYDKVRVIVRGSIESMTASAKELNYLHKVNVSIFDNFNTKQIVGDENGNVCAMEFEGLDDNSQLTLDADTVIFAVGQMSDDINKIASVETDDRGTVITNDFKTSIEDIFATGDIVNGEKTACYAASLGIKSAEMVNKYLEEVKSNATL